MTTTKSLPIVGAGAPAERAATPEKVEARTLAAAQRLLDDGALDQAMRKLAPLALDPTTPVRAHAGLLYAGLLLMSGRASEAVAVLERVPAAPAFALDEGYRWMLTACALRSARRYADALAAALRAVEHGPTAGRLLVLADAQKHAGALAEAIATLERLLAGDARHATALAQLAGYRNLAGALDEGARVFDAFLGAVAAQGSAAGADAQRNRAFYCATRDDLEGTLAALAQALRAEPMPTRGYIEDEVELDRFRALPAFRAL